MNEDRERFAALAALSDSKALFFKKCDDEPDMLETLEKLDVITRSENERASFESKFDGVVAKLEEKVKREPQLFFDFCRKIREFDELRDLANKLSSELSLYIMHGEVI